MKKICIYHANCSDGFTAAWVVKKACELNEAEPEIEFHPANYGEPAPDVDVESKDVIIVDFSYPRGEMLSMSEKANSITILDHHKTAKDNLKDLSSELKCQNEIIFDMEKSGCRLAWDYYFPNERHPAALLAVEDRDIWKFEVPYTKEISAYISSIEQNFENWDYIMDNENIGEAIDSGISLLRKHQKDIDSLYDSLAMVQNIDGSAVPTANVPYMFASDLGNKMCKLHPYADFSATYYMDKEGNYKFSLRSTDEQKDVSEIARKFGGDGHRNASGFTCKTLPWEM